MRQPEKFLSFTEKCLHFIEQKNLFFIRNKIKQTVTYFMNLSKHKKVLGREREKKSVQISTLQSCDALFCSETRCLLNNYVV